MKADLTGVRGRFTFETSIAYAEASIYEQRAGVAETAVHAWSFEGGDTLRGRLRFDIRVDELDLRDEDDTGRVVLGIGGAADLRFLDEAGTPLFAGEVRLPSDEVRLVVDNNIVKDVSASARCEARGLNRLEGLRLSGRIGVVCAGLDACGFGELRLRGEGTVGPEAA